MDNLVKFPKQKRVVPYDRILDVKNRYVDRGGRHFEFLPWNIFLNILYFLARCIRACIQPLLLFFRPFLFLVCQYTVFFGMIGFIVCLVTHPHNPTVTYVFGWTTLGGIVVMQLYDGLIMLVAKGAIVRVLS